MQLAGFTSTGSKRPEVLFGSELRDMPIRMERSDGCRIWDEDGREFLDFMMALGAVGLGYNNSSVNTAVIDAVGRGAIGSLAPMEEEMLASDLCHLMPHLEQVRFFKTGAEAVAAAVRLARVATKRTQVLGCGYHGWLDWCSKSAGVPAEVQGLYSELPFNDLERSREMIRKCGDALAAVVIEPVVNAAPSVEWLALLRAEASAVGALLIYDEIKTAFRVGMAGAAGRWGGKPDLVVLGKALANGYPLAAVGGTEKLMHHVHDTWISSTMATEFVSIAAARATIRVAYSQDLPNWLGQLGGTLLNGLTELAGRYPAHLERAEGIPEMCHVVFRNEETSLRVSRGCAYRGLLFKRTGYNFVSLAHRGADVTHALGVLDEVLGEL